MLTNRQIANFRKAFANHRSTDIKLSKAQLTKMQKGGLLRFLGSLLKSGLTLLKAAAKPLGLLVLTAASTLTDASIHEKIGSGNHITLIMSNNDMDDILKIVKSIKDSGLLLDGTTKIVKNEVKKQKGGFLSILLDTLGAYLLGDLLTKHFTGRDVIRAGEGTIRAGYGSKNFNSSPINKL